MESRIRGDDNMEMEEYESIPDINNNDTNTPDHAMNNQSLEQSDSSPRRKQSQTVPDQSEMHPITNKKHCRSKKSNDKEQQSHSQSYKKLKKEIKEVRKDLSTLTSIVYKMDNTIRKQSLEPSEMKQMLEILEHQEESGSDISRDGRDADLLLTVRHLSDNINSQSQKEKDLPEMITTLPLMSQPLPLCVILPSSSSTLKQLAMAPLDQTVQIHEMPPSISIVNEESQLVCIHNNCVVLL
ncbi:hypothetical protein IC582_019432 [Cucumis melo]